ncbi:glycosyltransferase family 2 protein [bacterium]|nr:glycosyltransferase family 2 protein [bacterium]RQV94402.1 MAG: glycosyltransferase family 2 protein [bacterium]
MAARATVIIPTFGNARFARWAIQSVQQQTIQELEICLICDGSPQEMISFFKEMGKEDPRLKIFIYPKSPRTGEPYRDEVIRQTTGEIIGYCCHDDLWLPNHVQEVEEALKTCLFVHSIHASVNLPRDVGDVNTLFSQVIWIDLRNQAIVNKMLGKQRIPTLLGHFPNFFGLTAGAHTRESYLKLGEGWVTTPKRIQTDLYMWRKFLSAYGDQCSTIPRVTGLNFEKKLRKKWTEQERDQELKYYFEKIADPAFLRQIDQVAPRVSYPSNGPAKLIKWVKDFYRINQPTRYQSFADQTSRSRSESAVII